MNELKITLDTSINTYENIEVMQGYNYYLVATITDNFKKADLNGLYAKVEFLLPNYNFIVQVENITIADNVVKVKLDDFFNKMSGEVKANIVLTNGVKEYGSWTFNIIVKPRSLYDSPDIKSKIDIHDSLKELVDNSIEIIDNVPQAVEVNKTLTATITNGEQTNTTLNESIKQAGDIISVVTGEVVDARVGVDGVTYNSLNDRVKHEVDQLQTQISDASNLPFSSEYISAEHSVKGVCKDMIVKGKTLQNLADNGAIQGGESSGYFYNWNGINQKVTDKTVTLINMTNKRIEYQLYNGSVTKNIAVLSNSSVVSIVESTFHLRSVLGYVKDGWSESNKTELKGMILEGSYTSQQVNDMINGYFEGIKSVSETSNKISILSCGKNLLNISKCTFEGKRISESSGGLSLEGVGTICGDGYSEYIKIKPNTSYIYSCENKPTYTPWALYDSDKKFIKGYSGVAIQNTPSNAEYIRITVSSKSIKEQLEEGTQATTYEPYREDKRDISLSGAFGQWNSLNFNTSELIEGTFKKVLNGASGEIYNFLDEGTNSARFYMDLSNVKPSQLDMICNKFKTLSTTSIDEEAIEIDGSKRLIIRILKSKLTGYLTTMTAIEKVNLFKTWLTTNNVEFYCQLATPIITKLNLDAMTSYNTMTHVFTSNTDELSPNIECKIPCNTPMVISSLRALNADLEGKNMMLSRKVEEERLNSLSANVDQEYRLLKLEMGV